MARKNFGLKNFFFSFSFVTVCIVLYIFRNINGSVDMGVAENGNLEDIIRADGIVVKDEEVYSATLDGSVSYYYNDGTKIKEGQLVADLNTDTNSAQINKQIAEVQIAIDLKNNSEKETVAVLSNEILLSYENEIQASILNEDLDTMYKIVGQVNNNGMHTYSDDKYEGYDVKQLETLKNSMKSSASTNKVPYYSNQAGLITYKIDGLEDLYKFENVMSITPSSTIKKEYTTTDKSQVETVVKNESIYKIIKNYEYYLAATVDNEKAKLFEENKYIKTRILSEGSQHEVWGYIKKINYGSEESVLILYFDDYFYKIYDKRYVDLELITDIHEGLKISTKALIEVNGLTGVYVEDASNIIKFFPVEILGQDENNVIVSIGEYVSENERRQIFIDENGYSTIKIFDKVILEPEKVYEGQIAD